MSKKRLTPAHRIRRRIRGRDSSFHPRSHLYKWWLLGNVMIGTFMAVLDATIVNVGLPKIMAAFGVGVDKIEWVITAYMLAMAVMLPTSAWLADRFGYKRMYFMGLLLFTIGSFFCGFSNNENLLIISRIIQGLGAGAIMPLGMAIVTREFPPEQRGVALGFWAISSAASVSFGPLIGGYLVDHFTWQLIFDVNVPIGILGMLVTVIIQREYKNRRPRQFDLVGFLSVIIFLPLLLYALAEGAASTNSEGWHAPHVLICFAVSIIALGVFLTNELAIEHPLIELRLLKNYNFGVSNIMMFIFGIGMFGSTFLLPLYLQNSLGYTAIQAGSVFLPVGIIQGIMSPVSGKIADRLNPKIPIAVGLTLLAFSLFLNGRLSYLTEHRYIMLLLYIRGFAMGLFFTPLSSVALLEIPREKLAQASGLFNVIRQIGGSFGIALLATLLLIRINFHNQIYSQAVDMNSPVFSNATREISYRVQHDAGMSRTNAVKISQSAVIGQINKEAYIEAINDDFMLAGIITMAAVLPVLLLHVKRKKTKEEEEYEIPIE
jgi:MFS transporter, DHA2 family, multidrug resistance protein